jgi:3-hydroxyisobutyrate dehydrogenase-like beta-hydroxyacid dehydrogenase
MELAGKSIGVIGLGQMGGGIAANLARAGYTVRGYDPVPAATEKFSRAGGKIAASNKEIAAECDIVVIVVEGKIAIHLADEILLPAARPGQIFIDHSTMPVPDTRRLGSLFQAISVQYLDAPISGGYQGADAGTLRVFVGGDRETAMECWPLFEAIGNRDKIVYCGPTGMGQAAKVVQQLTLRLPDLARMEVLMFGMRAGLDDETLLRALDITADSNDRYGVLFRAIQAGTIDRITPLVPEWPYYLAEAHTQGFPMPMLEGLLKFVEGAELRSVDSVNRPEPSLWWEYMHSTWSGQA